MEQKGRGRALQAIWSGSDADGAGLHGRRPVHRPERAAAAGRPADVRALRPGHRHPAGPRLPGGPRAAREVISRCYNLILRASLGAEFTDAQCGFKAIRRRPGPRAAAADRRHRLVLRHRTAGAGRASRAAHPRGAGRLDRRPRLAGRHRRHRPGRPAAASSGWRRASLRGRSRCRDLRRARPRAVIARPSPGPTVPAGRRFAAIGVASTAAYLLLFLLMRGVMPRPGRQPLACWSPRSPTRPPTGGYVRRPGPGPGGAATRSRA